MSEPHEIRGPYEAYVVLRKSSTTQLHRAMGCIKVESSATSEHHVMLFETLDAGRRALADIDQEEGQFKLFKVRVSFVEEIK
jgi:hypothetical protein